MRLRPIACAALWALTTRCASAPPLASSSLRAPPADLRPGLPPLAATQGAPCGASACAETGEPVRVSIERRSAQVQDLYERYLRAIYDHSLDAVRPLLADFVSPSEQGPASFNLLARESVIGAHARLFQVIDTGGRPFATVFAPPRVYAGGATGSPGWLRPMDYLARGDASAFRRFATMSVPSPIGMPMELTLVIRWVDDAPRIVGLSASILALGR